MSAPAARAARIAPDDAPLVLVGAADIGAAAMAQPLGGDIDMGPMPAGPWTSLEDLEAAVREDLERAEQALAGRAGVATRIEVGSLASALEEVAGDAEGCCWRSTRPRRGGCSGSSTATRAPG